MGHKSDTFRYENPQQYKSSKYHLHAFGHVANSLVQGRLFRTQILGSSSASGQRKLYLTSFRNINTTSKNQTQHGKRILEFELKLVTHKTLKNRTMKLSEFCFCAFSAAIYGVGMTVYTVEQSNTLHNSTTFIMQIGSTMQKLGAKSSSMFSGMMGSSSGFGGNGRKRRQSNELGSLSDNSDALNKLDSSERYNPSFTLPDISTYDYDNINSNEVKSVSDYQLASNDIYHQNSDSLPDPKQVEEMVKQIFGNLDPVFGYSLYLGWIGFL